MYERASATVMILLCFSLGAAAFQQREFMLERRGMEFARFRRGLFMDSNDTSPPPKSGSGHGLNPSVVIIVVILTVVFLLSGFLHLLARCCGRVVARREPVEGPMSALHGQLQHLFQLHDSGVDQAFIDTLPVFPYKAICGLKEGTDCAVCLSEFEGEDRLRLLPKCKHAFHVECIDTWLLSHSTCPICRCALLSDDTTGGTEPLSDTASLGSARSMRSNGYLGDSRRSNGLSKRMIASSSMFAEQGGSSESDRRDEDARLGLDSPDIVPVSDRSESEVSVCSVLSVRLGRVERRADNENIGGSSILKGRSYSLGSYEYVVDPTNLQVVIAPTPYPGRGSSKDFVQTTRARHRRVFSDGIPELGSIPGTPTDELFWATRGLATPEYGTTPGSGTPDFLSRETPDFITMKGESKDGDGKIRLNLGHDPSSEASLVPKGKQLQLRQGDRGVGVVEGKGKEKVGVLQQEERGAGVVEGKGKEKVGVQQGKEKVGVLQQEERGAGVAEGKGKEKVGVQQGNCKEWIAVDVESKEEGVESSSFEQRSLSPLQEVFKNKCSESEESRVLAGLERFFGTGWRSNVGLEKLSENMFRRDRAAMEGGSVSNFSVKSKPPSEQGELQVKDKQSVSSRSFSFRLPKRSRRPSFSESTTAGLDMKGPASVASTLDTASNDATGYETATSKDGGYETASKESFVGLDTSSVGSVDSSFLMMVAPATQQHNPLPQDRRVALSESSPQTGSFARKTIHWLMGRDRRVVYATNFSPTT